ncbi:hypothetical protein BsWGS_00406 [Bradybaena similaris]
MSLSRQAFAVAMLLCFLNLGISAGVSLDSRLRMSPAEADANSSGLSPQSDSDYSENSNQALLDALLARPSKRLWCRKGMTYNHVLGSCTPSFTAIRGKGRRQQL